LTSLPRFFIFALLLLTTSGGAHWLIARWAMRVWPRLEQHKRAIQVVVGVLVVAAPLFRVISRHTHSAIASGLAAATMFEVMTVMISVIPLALVGLAGRAAARRPPAPPEPAPRQPAVTRRQVLEGIGGVAVLAGTGSMLGWGMVRGRHAFALEEIVVRVPGLPKVLDGYTIGQVSDIHTGVFVGERELAEGMSRLREVKADLIVVTGDMVDSDPRFAPMLARTLSDLRARDGVTTILGNHDYYTGVAEVLRALEREKIDVLVNRGKVLRQGDGGGFALLGVDDMWAWREGGLGPDLDEAIASVPPDLPRILLAHQPSFVPDAAGRVALQLSGHTHGGQINPGFRPASLFLRYLAGRYEVGGTTLYINRGFGVAGPPARVGAPPEVSKIVLVSA
jgi:predicted MPP superfamily phosphohydrolase